MKTIRNRFRRKCFGIASRVLASIVACGWASSSVAQVNYPSTFQITDRDAPGQIRVRLQDFAVAPNTASNPNSTDRTAAQVARINFIRQDPTNSNRFVVPDLNGNLYTLDKTTRTFSTYLNFSQLFSGFDINPGFAAGLVTVQFDPGFLDSTSAGYGAFYTTHTEVNPEESAFRIGILTQWKVPGSPGINFGNPAVLPAAREMLRVTYSSNVHPLGDITFNPNALPGDTDYRMMYIASGDGAAGESSNGTTRNRPQMLNNYLGKVLRIQPNAITSASPYSIPSDNPYASATFTNAGAKGEIWAYGFRNPHRLEFDASPNGNLIVNDIGLNSYEEINIVHQGANYGYSKIEGNQLLNSDPEAPNYNQVNSSLLPVDLPIWVSTTPSDGFNNLKIVPTYPVAQFSQRDGDAISSGFVYRGTKIPSLVGKYVFGDITTARLFYVDYAAMLSQNAELGGSGNPLTMPQIHEMQVVYEENEIRVFDLVRDTFDLRNETPLGSVAFDGVDDNDRLPGSASATNTNDPYGVAYRQADDSQGGRADIRWAIGPDNELYLISKADGMVRALIHPGDYTGVFGDFNFDSQFTNLDIQNMLNALADSSSFKNTHQLADEDLVAMGDFNHDSQFNAEDIRGMLRALVNGGVLQPVPEPTAVSLAALGIVGLMVLRARRKLPSLQGRGRGRVAGKILSSAARQLGF